MFYIIGIIITFFLAFLLLGKRGKTISDKILCLWFVVIGTHLVLFYLSINKLNYQYPYLLGINIIFPLLHGPFIFLYTSALTNQLKNWKLNSLHFLPAMIILLCFMKFFLLPNQSKIAVYESKGFEYRILLSIYSVLVKLSGIVYILWSLLLLRKHKKNIISQFSNTDKINLNWLQYLIFGVTVVWSFVIFGTTSHLYFAVVVFVISMGYLGINQVGIFTPISIDHTHKKVKYDDEKVEAKTLKSEKQKYVKSGLTDEEAFKIHVILTKKMQDNQWYTNPDLTLVELAKMLEVHPNILSQVINTFEEKNFYDYVNALRIAKFISLAKIPKNKKYTILSLCYECGFNSKSSFNKYFKKVTHTTPSQFMNELDVP
jgi:AraC-like DNA-binding protein